MSKASDWEKRMEDHVHRLLEYRACRKLTKKEAKLIFRDLAKGSERHEVEVAIDLLRSKGYSVRKKR